MDINIEMLTKFATNFLSLRIVFTALMKIPPIKKKKKILNLP